MHLGEKTSDGKWKYDASCCCIECFSVREKKEKKNLAAIRDGKRLVEQGISQLPQEAQISQLRKLVLNLHERVVYLEKQMQNF